MAKSAPQVKENSSKEIERTPMMRSNPWSEPPPLAFTKQHAGTRGPGSGTKQLPQYASSPARPNLTTKHPKITRSEELAHPPELYSERILLSLGSLQISLLCKISNISSIVHETLKIVACKSYFAFTRRPLPCNQYSLTEKAIGRSLLLDDSVGVCTKQLKNWASHCTKFKTPKTE